MGDGRFRALVIGVDHYPQLGAHRQLHGCVNDALAMQDFLVDRVGVRQIASVLSPHPERRLPGSADAAAIRAAFTQLAGDTRPGDEVIVYFAGHGARVTHSGTGEYLYGFVPSDAAIASDGPTSLVLGRELHHLAHTIVDNGANPTMILDTCHSGGSVRGSNEGIERRLVPDTGDPFWRLSPSAYEALTARDPVVKRRTGGMDAMRDWVMVTACRDIEVARECAWSLETRGVFTTCLLAELASSLGLARWSDLATRVTRAVRARSNQRPTVEGRGERLVFGAASQTVTPGFKVSVGGQPDQVSIAAGALHGVDVGATVAIGNVRVVIESATPFTSIGRGSAPLELTAASRAVVVVPSPHTVRTRALLSKLSIDSPPSITVVTSDPADVEIRLWRNEWVMVADDAVSRDITLDDVIAHLGESSHPAFSARVDGALAHWARYRELRERSFSDATLFGLVDVALVVGETPAASTRCIADTDGIHQVKLDQPLWVEMTVRPSNDELFLGILLCSNDGNIIDLWPPRGAAPTAGARGAGEMLPEGQTFYVGADQAEPAFPTIRDRRTASTYTFKVIGCTVAEGAEPPDLSTLAIPKTVQEIVDRARPGSAKDLAAPVCAFSPRWATWDLVVRVAR